MKKYRVIISGDAGIINPFVYDEVFDTYEEALKAYRSIPPLPVVYEADIVEIDVPDDQQ